MSTKKSIKFNAVLNSLRTILNVVFPLITFPYASRILLVDEIGKYNFSSSIISYFLLIAALGVDKYSIREGAKYRDNRVAIGEFASRAFSINIVSTVISYILLFIYLTVSQKAHNYLACILIFSLQIFFTTLGTEWLYSIFEEYQYITIRSIVFKLISIVLLFVFVRQPGDYLKYAAITVFATVGSNIMNFVNIHKLCDLHLTFNFNWKKMVGPILIIFASNVAISIYVSSDTIMLGYMKNDYTVGIYSVATKIYNVILPVLASALTVAIPRFAVYAGKGLKKEYDELLLKASNTLFIVTIPAIVGLIMLSEEVVVIVGGAKYLESQIALRLLSLAMIFSIFSGLFNQCVLLPYHREKYSLMASIISAVENILLNLVLIPIIAEKGAALTTVFAEATMACMNYYNSRDIVRSAFVNKVTAKNLASIGAGVAFIVLICRLSQQFISGFFLHIVFSVIGSIVSYIGVLLLFRNPIALSMLNQIKSKIRSKR